MSRLRKNILLLLVLILSPMVCYSEIPTEIEKPLKTEVRLGYEPNYFSPTNDLHYEGDSIKTNKVKEDAEDKKLGFGAIVGMSFMNAIMFYLIVGSVIFLFLTVLGCFLLIVGKIIQVYRKKR
jgi:hypothetical protein